MEAISDVNKFATSANNSSSRFDRAERFYETIWGLKPAPDNNNDTTSDTAIFECGNSILIKLYQCGPSAADHTVATFEISNIEDEVSTFRG